MEQTNEAKSSDKIKPVILNESLIEQNCNDFSLITEAETSQIASGNTITSDVVSDSTSKEPTECCQNILDKHHDSFMKCPISEFFTTIDQYDPQEEILNKRSMIIVQPYQVEIRFSGSSRNIHADKYISLSYSNKPVSSTTHNRFTIYTTKSPYTKVIFTVNNPCQQKFVIISPTLVGGIIYVNSKFRCISIPSTSNFTCEVIQSNNYPCSSAFKFISKHSVTNACDDNIDLSRVAYIEESSSTPSAFADLIILQAPLTIFKIKVTSGENPEIKAGLDIVAWTPDIQFKQKGTIIKKTTISTNKTGIIWLARSTKIV